MYPILFRVPIIDLPIYSYGVMLGLSLVVGWFLVMKLGAVDGLPRDKMGTCFVWTAVAAILGSRVLYIITNLSEYRDAGLIDMLNLRKGGLVAYGGFLGGFIGSWLYLYRQKIRLLAWADIVVPTLATGLGLALLGAAALVQLPGQAETQGFIVQGADLAAVTTAVQGVGGEITHELGIINAVAAQMTESEIAALKRNFPDVRLMHDAAVEVAGKGGNGGLEFGRQCDGVQSAFRCDLLPLLRDQTDVVRLHVQCDGHDFRCVRHLQVQACAHALA